jgi:UDP-galactopyranose mutase
MEVPYTRVHEHKHFAPWETHEKSIVLTEFSKETEPYDIPYYPKRLAADREILSKYIEDAQQDDGIYFLGRLATYRYMDMDDVIAEALDFSKRYLDWKKTPSQPRPKFGNDNEI